MVKELSLQEGLSDETVSSCAYHLSHPPPVISNNGARVCPALRLPNTSLRLSRPREDLRSTHDWCQALVTRQSLCLLPAQPQGAVPLPTRLLGEEASLLSWAVT